MSGLIRTPCLYGFSNILARELVTSTTTEKDITEAIEARSSNQARQMTERFSKSNESESHDISAPMIIQHEKSSQTLPPSPALRNLDRLLLRKQEPDYYQSQQLSFWSSTSKMKPVTALAATKSRRAEKENETGKQSEGEKARMEIIEKKRKRNILLSGQGRVKRVEFDVDKVFTSQEEVVRASLAIKQDKNQ